MPLISIKGLYKHFPAGDELTTVLNNVSFEVQAGEFVAIIGSSGSGKSTLMNILGCLDKPSAGHYAVNGIDISQLSADNLADLRRDYFGFIFQRYHLLSSLSAIHNVEVPAVYAGVGQPQRSQRAQAILAQLGLEERLAHQPNQLSGGQQQRVSIARALMNGGHIILADEPTGALDSQNGAQVLKIIDELHQQGHTIIMVTHDPAVAAYADRVIEMKDGKLIADTRKRKAKSVPKLAAPQRPTSWRAAIYQIKEAFYMAVNAILAHKMRSFLTMLGIIIGIASVVSVVALGQGSKQKILSNISGMGTNTIDIYRGSGFGDRNANAITTLTTQDAVLLKKQPYINSVSPNINTTVNVVYANQSVSAQIKGVGDEYFQVKDIKLEMGRLFDADSVNQQMPYIVIDDNTKKTFFADDEDPIGKVLLLKNVPARIIGFATEKNTFGPADRLNIWMPYTTVASRLTGNNTLNNITVRVQDNATMSAAEAGVTKLLITSHGKKDFFTSNSDSVRETVEQTTGTMTLLISAIAVISLIVGGIGVMNIMLVSVTERTKEIGIRMAIGAKQHNILQQFLIEAVLVCLTGGTLGILLSLCIGQVFNYFIKDFAMAYSSSSIILAFACSSLIGIIFGFLPARNAAKLDPIVALARD